MKCSQQYIKVCVLKFFIYAWYSNTAILIALHVTYIYKLYLIKKISEFKYR